LGTFAVIILFLIKKGRDFRGVRWYCFNLMLCNILYLTFAIFNNTQYPFANMVSNTVKSNFKTYHQPVKQWFYSVYCYSTAFLFAETIFRVLSERKGFYHIFWFIFLALIDSLPLTFGYLRTSIWRYVDMDPEPFSIFHGIGFLALWLTFALMFLAFFCCLCRISSKHGEDNSNRFSRRSFIFIFIYGIITIWWQCPAAYEIINGIMATKVTTEELIAMTKKFYALVAPLTISKDYAEYSVPVVIAWSMIFFLPSISLLNFGVRKATTTTRINDSHEHLTAVTVPKA
jgi:hypothetical protein